MVRVKFLGPQIFRHLRQGDKEFELFSANGPLQIAEPKKGTLQIDPHITTVWVNRLETYPLLW